MVCLQNFRVFWQSPGAIEPLKSFLPLACRGSGLFLDYLLKSYQSPGFLSRMNADDFCFTVSRMMGQVPKSR